MTKRCRICHAWVSALPHRLRLDYDPCKYGLAVALELMLDDAALVCVIERKKSPRQTRVSATAKQWNLARARVQAKLRKGAANAND